ncbi:MAG: hypothetical protein EXR63_03900 [Dehalococcoidia bacterium]|nr:hypothetical protein [Dehalococcoidia bacterium]
MADYLGTSLRGYGRSILRRDNWTCAYCELDGKVWPHWLFLSVDHLLPFGHPQRNDERFIVTACVSYNGFLNRNKWDIEGKTPAQLIAQKAPLVRARREEFKAFWASEIATDATELRP